MGVVYHANFLVWFEVGRVELMRALGVEYKKMEKEDDCHIVVADVHCRYHHSARYDEVLRIRTRIAESKNRVVVFSDRKSTRLNSSHGYISYAVFCLKKKITYTYADTDPVDA